MECVRACAGAAGVLFRQRDRCSRHAEKQNACSVDLNISRSLEQPRDNLGGHASAPGKLRLAETRLLKCPGKEIIDMLPIARTNAGNGSVCDVFGWLRRIAS